MIFELVALLGFIISNPSFVASATKTPLCLNFSDGGNFCSVTKMANGEKLSGYLNTLMKIPIGDDGDFQPVAFNETTSLPADVPVTTKELDERGKELFDFLDGPESLAMQGDFLYAATAEGIFRVNIKTSEKRRIYDGNSDCGHVCSRPLGIRIKNKTMYCADLLKGLVEIDLETEKFKVLLPLGVMIDGVKFFFPNDLDVDLERNLIYVSESNTKWGWTEFMFSLMEFDDRSRVIQFNLTSGEAKTFADGLHLANGVQISYDRKNLLVGEFTARRVSKFSLEESLPVKGSAFTVYLPGNVDNIRPSARGGYWIALIYHRVNGSRTLLEELQARPEESKKILNLLVKGGSLAEALGVLSGNKQLLELSGELKNGNIIGSAMPTEGAVAETDADGKVLRVLRSTKFGDLSEVLEVDTGLYVGSYVQKRVVNLPAEYVGPNQS